MFLIRSGKKGVTRNIFKFEVKGKKEKGYGAFPGRLIAKSFEVAGKREPTTDYKTDSVNYASLPAFAIVKYLVTNLPCFQFSQCFIENREGFLEILFGNIERRLHAEEVLA